MILLTELVPHSSTDYGPYIINFILVILLSVSGVMLLKEWTRLKEENKDLWIKIKEVDDEREKLKDLINKTKEDLTKQITDFKLENAKDFSKVWNRILSVLKEVNDGIKSLHSHKDP